MRGIFLKKNTVARIMTRVIICLVILFGATVFLSDNTSLAKKESESRGGYEILSYDCYYKVSENNTYQVIETIDVNFTEPRHGIYRRIPEVNNIERMDGSHDTVITSVDVKACSDKYTDSRDGDDRKVKIGDPDKEITGRHKYTIQYEVKWGNDRVKDEDEFYMNLIGDGWDVPVNNLTFAIEFPKEFKDTGKNIGFYYGRYKDTKLDGIKYNFDGKTIRGSLVGYSIMPGSFFTTRVQLEDGYFLKEEQLPIDGVIAVVLASIFLVISLVIWMRIGVDKDIIEVVEFYPPDGLNCGEMGYAAFGSITNKEIVPMLIGLASKGYLEIVQTDTDGKEYSFKLLRHYEGPDTAEGMFLEGLWQYGEVVTKKELEKSFYKTLAKVKKQIKTDMEPKIFIKNTLWIRYITIPFAFIPYYVGLFKSFSYYVGEREVSVVLLFVVPFFVSMFMSFVPMYKISMPAKVIFCIFTLAGIIASAIIYRNILSYSGPFYWVVYFACIIANIIQIIFLRVIDKRTDYGIDLLGRIRGFKNYLEIAERPHLVQLVEQDPEYFYKILPYTYVLGVTTAWADKFESIAMEPPGWYRSPYGTTFHYHSFNSFMNRTMTSTTVAMTSTPGGGGGGFSGGGGGGGGGGSW